MEAPRRMAVTGLKVTAAVFVGGGFVAYFVGDASATRSPGATALAYVALWALFGLPVSLGIGGMVIAGMASAAGRLDDRGVLSIIGVFVLPLVVVFLLLLAQMGLRSALGG